MEPNFLQCARRGRRLIHSAKIYDVHIVMSDDQMEGAFVRDLLRYLRPHRVAIVFVVTFIFIQCLCNLYLPTLMAHIVDNGVLVGNVHYILAMGAFMLVVSVGAVLFSIAAGFLSSRTASDFGRVLRREVFSHVEQFSLHEFDNFGASSLITRTTNDITQVQQLVNMMLRMMIMAPLNCIGGVIMAVYTDAKLSWIIVVILPLLTLVIWSVFRRATQLFRTMQGKIDTLNRVLRENLSGIRVIRSFNRIDHEFHRFDEANQDLTGTTTRVQKIMASLMPVLMLIINLSTVAIIWFGGLRIEQGSMKVGALIAFIQYVMQLLFSIMMVSMMFFMIPRAMASATRIREVLTTAPGVQNDADAHFVTEGRGEVAFRDVEFRYPGAENPALSHITFVAKPGQVTAIIGGTGAGKSTLLNLIPRFFDVTAGNVLVDGIDVRNWDQAELRKSIGYVPQQAVLFTGTVADNLRFGLEDATDVDMEYASSIAQASEFIETLDGGLQALVERGGKNLSGGQKQRLSIARAIVKKPTIYLFDDSFSALDFRTDARLRAALRSEVANSTMIVVAQRVHTVRDADQIIVLNEGRIAGIGTHDALLTNCDVYREIVDSQRAQEETA